MTKVAVLIPVYNNQAGLSRSLDSLSRAEGTFSVVVVDDGSREPIRAPSHIRSGIPVSLLRLDRNMGIAAALNHGLRFILRGGFTYVGRLDSGDTIVPERFERQVQFLDADPSCAAVSSFVDFVDAKQSVLFRYRAPSQHSEILRQLRVNNCLIHSGSMIRASVLEQLGLYLEEMHVAEDYELFLRMARRYTLAVIPEVLTRCEYSLSGLSVVGRRRQQRERLKLQIQYFDPASPYSFYGVARTLVALMTPHFAVFRFKRAYFR